MKSFDKLQAQSRDEASMSAQSRDDASLQAKWRDNASMQTQWHGNAFMQALYGKLSPYVPVWFMRQAGRYQAWYRTLREKHSFAELCQRPELSAHITIEAVKDIHADAAIIFSDILLILEAMGAELNYVEGRGPVLGAVRNEAELGKIRDFEPESLGYVYEAERIVRQNASDIPLIGFAGAPFTLAAYLIEGGASRDFRATKTIMYSQPVFWQELMSKLSHAVKAYLHCQAEAGVQALQLFDTWAGVLSPADYRQYVLPYAKPLADDIPVPLIYFAKGVSGYIEIAAEVGDVLSLDHGISLGKARDILGTKPVQGNLEPMLLLADFEIVKQRAISILEGNRGRAGFIFNLGHGILPCTNADNVRRLADFVREHK